MNTLIKKSVKIASIAAIFCPLFVTAPASAHDLNMWPSEFNLHSKKPTVVTVDLTFSEMAFRLDHSASASGFSVLDPQGKPLRRVGNIYQSAQRTTVDLPIEKQGTYTLRYQGEPRYFTSYSAGKKDKKKRLFANKVDAQAQLPNSANNVVTKKYITSGLSFITNTLPSEKPYQATNKGLEITPVTHPSDYVTNEPLTLKVTYNGEPLTDFPVSLKRDGAQYTSNSTPNKSMTDKEGEIHFSFEQGGRYILSVNHSVTENAPLYDEVTYRLYYAFEVNFE